MNNQTQRTTVTCIVLLVALVFVVFGQTLNFGFVNFDDDRCVYANPAVIRGSVAWAFTHAVNANWVPITTLSHMLDCQLYGLNPRGHHLTNVLLHAAAAVLLFIALRRLTGATWRSFFVAAVFAVHPLRAESVAWISERKDVLSAFFFMLTLNAYTFYCAGSKRWTAYALTLVAFALGLMSKPMLVTVPIVLLMLDFWPLRRLLTSTKQCLVEKIPFVALSAAAAAVTMLSQKETRSSFELLLPTWRAANAAISYVIYIKQMTLPTDLAVFYPHPGRAVSVGLAALCLVVIGAITVVAWKQRANRPYLMTGWLWYVIMLVPVIGLVQAGAQAHADRYTYLPQIGFYICIAWGATGLASKFRVQGWLPWAAAAIIVALCATATVQAANWRDSETLWAEARQHAAPSALAETCYGSALEEKGNLDGAMQHYQRALALDPNYCQAQNNVGYVLMLQHDVTGAAEHYQAALRIEPTNPKIHYNIGNLCDMQGDTAGAISFYKKAVEIDPQYAQAHYNLGNEYLNTGNFTEAITHYRAALETNPNDAATHLNLANALAQKGQSAEAISHFERALQLNPKDPMSHYNLAFELSHHGRVPEATTHFESAYRFATEQNNSRVAEAAKQQLDASQHH